MPFARRVDDALSVPIGVATLLVLAAGWGLFAWHVNHAREAALDRARNLVSVLSRTLAEHTTQVLFGVDYALQSLDERGDQPGTNIQRTPAAVHEVLRRLRETNPVFGGVAVTNREGRSIANADSPTGSGADLSQRDSFKALRDGQEGLIVSTPIKQSTTRQWAIPISRRLVDGKGEFAGMITALLRPEYFRDLYRAPGVSLVSLVRHDGTLLIREPGTDAAYESGSRASSRAVELMRKAPSGIDDIVSAVDGIYRVVGYTSIRDHPLSVFVGINHDLALAEWRADTQRVAVAAVVASIVIVLFAGLLLYRVRRQVELTRHLARARQEAETARQSAEAANRAKSEFLAHMSHELRTPLNAINGFCEMMLLEMHGPLGDRRYAGYLRDMKMAGEHLGAVIGNILDMTKIDTGRWEVELAACGLYALAADLRGMLSGRAEDSGITLRIDLPPLLPDLITDRRMLLQVLLHVVGNAFKVTPAGGSVRVEAQVEGDSLVLTVTDDGIAMSPEEMIRALQPFDGRDSQIARGPHDAGLGLPLSRRFAELLGGRLDMTAVPSGGTRVTIRLPFRPMAGAAGVPEASAPRRAVAGR